MGRSCSVPPCEVLVRGKFKGGKYWQWQLADLTCMDEIEGTKLWYQVMIVKLK